MEDVFYAGQAVGWAPTPVDTASLDPRAGAFADTRFAHTGRHSLRVVNPAPAVTALSLGVSLLANMSHVVSLHVRGLGSGAGKVVQLVTLAPKPSTYHGEQPLTLPVVVHHRMVLPDASSWQAVEVTVSMSGGNGTLALMTEEALIYWLDDVAVLAAATP